MYYKCACLSCVHSCRTRSSRAGNVSSDCCPVCWLRNGIKCGGGFYGAQDLADLVSFLLWGFYESFRT